MSVSPRGEPLDIVIPSALVHPRDDLAGERAVLESQSLVGPSRSMW